MRFLLIFSFSIFAAGVLMLLPSISQAAVQGNQKILTVYFSHTNNTKTVAEHIHSIVGGDMIQLKTVNPYPVDHDAAVRVAVKERRSDARPELATVFPNNMGEYDIIFVGYPVWEYTMPMVFFTFFDQYKFPGKTIIPFSTHLGSGLGGGPEDIAKLCPQAKIIKGLAIRGTKAADSRQEVVRWLQQLGLMEK